MRTLLKPGSRHRPRIRRDGPHASNIEFAVAGNRELLSGTGLTLVAGQGNGAALQALENPWKGIPNTGVLQYTGNYGPVLARRRANDANGAFTFGGIGWTLIWGMYVSALSNGYVMGIMINDSTNYNTSSQSGNWRLYQSASDGRAYLDMVYYNNPISWAATSVNSGANFFQTGFHVYAITRTSATNFDFYRDGEYFAFGTSADGGFGGPPLFMGAETGAASLGFHCHSAVHGNNTYSLGNSMIFAVGMSKMLDRTQLQDLTANPGKLLSNPDRRVAFSPATVHSMAASVNTTTTVGATLRKRARMAESVSTATTVSATPQARYRMQASVMAEATAVALLTDAALTQAIAAEVSAAASVTATATVRRRVAANVGTLTTVAALLGKRQRLEAFVFTQTTTSATMGRRQRLAAAISAQASVTASLRRKFLLSGTVEATATTEGTTRIRRRLSASVLGTTVVSVEVEGADALEPVIGNVRKVYLTTYVKKRNRMDRLELSSITAEYIDVVFVSKNDVLTYPVQMALAPVGDDPETWVDAEWVNEENYHRGTKFFNTARCLAGGAGLNIDTEGEYQLWIRVTGPGDAPIKKAGTVAVS